MKFFKELPTRSNVRDQPIDWAGAKAELMANPGEWGLIAENVASSTPQQLQTGKNKHFRGEELEQFEFRVMRPENAPESYAKRRTDLYGRYTATKKRVTS